MRSWTNHLASSDRYLHKAALNLAVQIQDVVKSNPALGFAMLEALIQKGKLDFDKVTKTKTVENIMGSLTVEGVREYVEYLKGLFAGTQDSDG